MRISNTTTHARATVGIATKMGAAAAPAPAMAQAPATTAKELTIAAAEDGSAVVSSTVEGAHVAFSPTTDAVGLEVSEVLPDGSVGETAVITPPLTAASDTSGESSDE